MACTTARTVATAAIASSSLAAAAGTGRKEQVSATGPSSKAQFSSWSGLRTYGGALGHVSMTERGSHSHARSKHECGAARAMAVTVKKHVTTKSEEIFEAAKGEEDEDVEEQEEDKDVDEEQEDDEAVVEEEDQEDEDKEHNNKDPKKKKTEKGRHMAQAGAGGGRLSQVHDDDQDEGEENEGEESEDVEEEQEEDKDVDESEEDKDVDESEEDEDMEEEEQEKDEDEEHDDKNQKKKRQEKGARWHEQGRRGGGGGRRREEREKDEDVEEEEGQEDEDVEEELEEGGDVEEDEDVNESLIETLKKGTSFGAPCYLENVLAKAVIDAVPSIEMVRFVNSGTEACMGMLRLARAFTKREKIIKFEGCYHGHADSFLVKAGSGVATLGLPDSPGVLKESTAATLTAPYNDLAAVEALVENNKDQVAAIILEPVVGNAGFIPPKMEFLRGLREVATKNSILLVFDEVMTGFRIAYGGAQEYFGVTPDLTTLGKIIGGGLPVGAYGGRREIMEMVAPAGPMYQAGTLSGNPVAMMAGIKTLERLRKPGTYEYLDKITSRLVEGLLSAARETGHAACGGSIRGMFGFFFCEGPVHNFEDAKKSDTEKFARFHRGMLEQGVYLAPSQYEAGFTGLCHTDEDIDFTINAAKVVMASL
ncbi:hypothetical protein CBR_g49915 [Chara braunii]|uniref:glutamate-1-semialdehyde 2,1-aminomutase n=1 Tax=Chara braunii TaxID=69332 RepID=A0A388JPD9_CHABU|nr:hypothetical protein CBR_g49915 [Chara braunii]|eukprot:GBG59651.1 hypothetical protein CBR_g49915 [Chara braunii]